MPPRDNRLYGRGRRDGPIWRTWSYIKICRCAGPDTFGGSPYRGGLLLSKFIRKGIYGGRRRWTGCQALGEGMFIRLSVLLGEVADRCEVRFVASKACPPAVSQHWGKGKWKNIFPYQNW